MTEHAPSATMLTSRAAALAGEGQTDDARRVLAEALAVNPDYEPAWLWFASLAANDAELRYCLEKAVAAQPKSKAVPLLAPLRGIVGVSPPEVVGVIDPPPPDLQKVQAVRSRARRRSLQARIAWALVAVAVLAAVAVVLTRPFFGKEPLSIAVALEYSGTGAAIGEEMLRSAQLYVDRINAGGGIGGRPVRLFPFDDRGDPETAKAVARRIIDDDRALVVIGHRRSDVSLAAGPIYAEAGIPVITPSATADSVTRDNPWYFRMTFDNTTEGFLLAAYVQTVLGAREITLIRETSDYGQNLADGIRRGFQPEGRIAQEIEIDTGGSVADPTHMARIETAANDAAATLTRDGSAPVIVLALSDVVAKPVLTALRRSGVPGQVVGSSSMGSDVFLRSFSDQPEEERQPGYFTDGILAASPLIMDSLTSEALRWYEDYRAAYGVAPDYRGISTYEAAIAAVYALRTAVDREPAADATSLRRAVRDALAALGGPAGAADVGPHQISGLLGPISFDETRTPPRSISIGTATGGHYESAPIQLRTYAVPAGADLADELASGALVEFHNTILERQRIVFAGINFNEVGDFDTSTLSFAADFFLWLEYSGDDAPTNIIFDNAVDPALRLGAPLKSSEQGGVSYRLYRVHGRFKAPLEFRDFPFDRQHLKVEFQHTTLPSSQLVFATDPMLHAIPHQRRLQSGVNAGVSIDAIPNWEATSVDVYQGTVGSTAQLGDPQADVTSSIDFSTFTADVTFERVVTSFLVKNLLPLALLAIVTYVALFIPPDELSTRISFGVTGILTTTVLLNTVTGNLPDVGYTVAVEWMFYAFIFLSASCILIALYGHRLHDERRFSAVRTLNVASRIYYPLFIAVVVLVYVVKFWR